MWEGGGHGLTGLAVRHHCRKLKLRMQREQAQQLPGDVTGAAEYHG